MPRLRVCSSVCLLCPACLPVPLTPVPARSSQCDRISIEFLANGIAPKWVGGRSDVFGTTRELWQCADAYRVQYPYFVLSAFCIVYITLQTLAIPGPIVLSVLSGALYDPIPAQLLVAFCATTGASLCFTISYFLGNDIVHVLLPSMITRFRKKVRLWRATCVATVCWVLRGCCSLRRKRTSTTCSTTSCSCD